jgi:chromosome segregation ATPase
VYLTFASRQEELSHLQATVERLSAEKSDIETQAAEQAETCRQLTDANNSLSGQVLSLADEGAKTQGALKQQLEVQLNEVQTKLKLAQEEIDAMRSSEQSQRIALLDELNTMQTENGQLRAQIRALKK